MYAPLAIAQPLFKCIATSAKDVTATVTIFLVKIFPCLMKRMISYLASGFKNSVKSSTCCM